MKKCSTSLAPKETQIKSTFRFYLAPVSMAIFKQQKTTQTTISGGKDAEGKEPLSTLVACKLV
jgi:hypothetical protein